MIGKSGNLFQNARALGLEGHTATCEIFDVSKLSRLSKAVNVAVPVKTMQWTWPKLRFAGVFSSSSPAVKEEGPYEAAHSDIECRSVCIGNFGVAGQRAERTPRCGQRSCAQKRHADCAAGGLQRHNRLLRLRPGLDQRLRTALLPLRPLLVAHAGRRRLRRGEPE